jgi:hypothetical protein
MPIFAELTEHEMIYCIFQQGSATAHTAHASLEAVQVFKDSIISHCLWPRHSPDLTPHDFYLWENLKDEVKDWKN